jgi:hypothetical protein
LRAIFIVLPPMLGNSEQRSLTGRSHETLLPLLAPSLADVGVRSNIGFATQSGRQCFMFPCRPNTKSWVLWTEKIDITAIESPSGMTRRTLRLAHGYVKKPS